MLTIEKEHRLSDCLKWIAEFLVSIGIEPHEARREAELILLWATGAQMHQLLAYGENFIGEPAAGMVNSVLEGRSRRVPLQYCLAHTYFMGLPFAVGPGVLIPRGDTEVLVETVAAEIQSRPGSVHLLEVGIGSGCIAISLLKRFGNLTVTAFEISEAAIACSKENAERHGVADRLTIIHQDFRQGLAALSTSVHIFVSNPPYIPLADYRELAPEVKDHEPREALVGVDDDGLGFYRDFACLLPLNTNTKFLDFFVEVGQGQAEAVKDIFSFSGYRFISTVRDLGGTLRVVCGRAPK